MVLPSWKNKSRGNDEFVETGCTAYPVTHQQPRLLTRYVALYLRVTGTRPGTGGSRPVTALRPAESVVEQEIASAIATPRARK